MKPKGQLRRVVNGINSKEGLTHKRPTHIRCFEANLIYPDYVKFYIIYVGPLVLQLRLRDYGTGLFQVPGSQLWFAEDIAL